MLFDTPKTQTLAEIDQRVTALNDRFRHHSATDVMRYALTGQDRVALVSSFGAESVVLLHMLAVIEATAPVIFIDTQMLFAETLAYQTAVAERLGLTGVKIIRANDAIVASKDPNGDLHKSDTNACCNLRKAAPLNTALAGFDGWITGRKRFQSGTRSTLEFFERDTATNHIKINPLAHWPPHDVAKYMDENCLPRHPLVMRGYPSIGCAPCTSPVKAGEDSRAGRWRNTNKDECGIHFVNGKIVRVTPKLGDIE